MKRVISYLLMITISLCLFACNRAENDENVWSEAIYTDDTELGNGKTTVFVEVIALDKSVTFTIHSNKNTLGEALKEHNLIDGEHGSYGLYVKKVNGIVADYDKNQTYWGFNKNGKSMPSGVDGTEFKDGEHYELVYTK